MNRNFKSVKFFSFVRRSSPLYVSRYKFKVTIYIFQLRRFIMRRHISNIIVILCDNLSIIRNILLLFYMILLRCIL